MKKALILFPLIFLSSCVVTMSRPIIEDLQGVWENRNTRITYTFRDNTVIIQDFNFPPKTYSGTYDGVTHYADGREASVYRVPSGASYVYYAFYTYTAYPYAPLLYGNQNYVDNRNAFLYYSSEYVADFSRI